MESADDVPSSRQLLAVERKSRILDAVRTQGFVRVRVLADQLGVAGETIRRDLSELEAVGMIARAHGGATTRGHAETNFDRRLHENELAKIAIGRAAATLVADGSTIFVDSGSTTIHLVRELMKKKELVVVTNAITHAAELMENREITVVMIGGVIRPPTFSTVGDVTVATLDGLSVDQTFLAINSLSVDKGLMYPQFDEVPVKRAMMAAASEVILLADHSKFNQRSLVRVAAITEVRMIVTDSGLNPATAEEVRQAGVELMIAEVDGPESP